MSGSPKRFRIGPEVVGPRGLGILVLAAVAAGSLAVLGAHNRGLGSASSTLAGAGAAGQSTAGARSPSGSTATTAHHSASNSTGNGSSSSGSRGSSPSTSKVGPALSSTPYAQYAFRVYPGPESPGAAQALSGFKVSVTPEGSRLAVTVTSLGSGQPPLHRNYAASDKVYFIEASLGDDSGNQEFNLGDDGILVTNAQGHILQ